MNLNIETITEDVDVVGSLSPPEQQEELWDGSEKPGNGTGETDEARGSTGESSVWPLPHGTLDVDISVRMFDMEDCRRSHMSC